MKRESLLVGIVHEIKNTTATMDGFLQLLADQVADDSRARHYVEMLSSELGHLEQLVEDSLHFTRVGTIPFSRCDLAAILNQIATKVAHLAEGSGIEVEVKASPCPLVYGTPKLLQQLLWNLVSNALAALSGPGQILLELAPVGDNWLRLTCRDTGPGISPADMTRIFQPYFTTKENGTGLGLPLCKQIAEFHGGRLEVESNLGSGTCFTLWLPGRQDLATSREA
ncbi:MAG: HAMP domain-containing sensor histidine kinase [bacterium]|nr:HAMP domain-containing histidine kinase [Bacillota bacterium]